MHVISHDVRRRARRSDDVLENRIACAGLLYVHGDFKQMIVDRPFQVRFARTVVNEQPGQQPKSFAACAQTCQVEPSTSADVPIASPPAAVPVMPTPASDLRHDG